MANKVLLVVFLLFLLSIGLTYFYKDRLLVQMFTAVMEAALVGGVADWFAITAIFRKPLGFPWHTAVIPRHRKQMIQAICQIIDQDLLTVDSIQKRVDHICFVNLFISFIENKRGKQLLRNWLDKSCREMINNLDIADIVGHLDGFVKKGIRSVDAVYQIKNGIRWLLDEGRIQVVTIYIVNQLINQLEKTEMKQSIYEHMEELAQVNNRPPLERVLLWLGEQTNSINISDAAGAFSEEVLGLLQEIKKPEHTFHKWLDEELTKIIEQPEMDFVWLDQIDSWKMILATNVDLSETAMHMADNFIATINPKLYAQLIDWMDHQLHGYWEFFKGNREIQEWLEVRVKRVTYQFIEKEHYIIREMVERVLSEFTDDKLNRFVEDKAGDDFQWIRINGSVVGGIVGLVIFLFMHYLYNDYVVPMVQGWL